MTFSCVLPNRTLAYISNRVCALYTDDSNGLTPTRVHFITMWRKAKGQSALHSAMKRLMTPLFLSVFSRSYVDLGSSKVLCWSVECKFMGCDSM